MWQWYHVIITRKSADGSVYVYTISAKYGIVDAKSITQTSTMFIVSSSTMRINKFHSVG